MEESKNGYVEIVGGRILERGGGRSQTKALFALNYFSAKCLRTKER